MKTRLNIEKSLPEKIPKGYRLGVDGWSFSKEKLEERMGDGTRKLLTLDISISPDEFVQKVNLGKPSELADRVDEFYGITCPNNCPNCFEKGDVRNYLLKFENIKDYVEQALKLGLESVKFLGPGELIANPNLFKILGYLQERDIKIAIFTKGGILGDDKLARKYQKMDSKELVKRICSYAITRVLIDCRSFDDEKAGRITHSTLSNYAQARDRTIELLVANGMSADLYIQRMSLQTNPVTGDNMDEILGIFKWGTERNIPVCVTPTMVSGKGKKLVEKTQMVDFQEKLIQLYTDIYIYLLERGIMRLEQLRKEGVSSYAGVTPCNQLSCGMFIRKDGVVLRCPGNDYNDFIIAEDVRKRPLKDIWMQSQNYALGPVFNNKCVKDGYSIPTRLYDWVLRRVEHRFRDQAPPLKN